MFRSRLRRFLHDEGGAGAIWGLFTTVLFIGIAGVAVDTTDGFRMRTILQSSADAAALAAVIDLPRQQNAIDSAVEYAEKNMPPDIYGTVLTPDDVAVGKWDETNRVFIKDDPAPDAVRVELRSTFGRGNAVLSTFLRVIGFKGWNLTAVAIAQKFIPQCYTDGLVARGYVDASSNNNYYNQFCIHGQQGVDMQSGSYFEKGTSVSMPDLSMLSIPSGGLTSNPGLQDALREGSLDPRTVNHVSDIMDMLLDPTSPIQPPYIDQTQPVITVDCQFDIGTAQQGRIYHVDCPANKQIQIPGNKVTSKIVVIAESQINIPAGAMLQDVFLASRATTSNDGANIHLASSVQLGKPDDCADGGGVQIFTTSDMFIASSVIFNGVQIVSAKNVSLGTAGAGVKGLAVQAGGNITLSSGNSFGLCVGKDPLLTNEHYRLVF